MAAAHTMSISEATEILQQISKAIRTKAMRCVDKEQSQRALRVIERLYAVATALDSAAMGLAMHDADIELIKLEAKQQKKSPKRREPETMKELFDEVLTELEGDPQLQARIAALADEQLKKKTKLAERECPKNHKLQLGWIYGHDVPFGSKYNCDVCGKKDIAVNLHYQCRECNYDVCPECRDPNKFDSKAPQSKPVEINYPPGTK